MKSAAKLRQALDSKSLTSITDEISDLADELAYQLKPPYTQVRSFKSKEDGDRFAIEFSASLHLHYSSLRDANEGLLFILEFSGNAYADSPTPPIHELFQPAAVQSLSIFGYGSRWKGESIAVPKTFAEHLEVSADHVCRMSLEEFFRILDTAA